MDIIYSLVNKMYHFKCVNILIYLKIKVLKPEADEYFTNIKL